VTVAFTTTKRADQLHHHDNAPAHCTALVQAFLTKYRITQVYQPFLQPSLRLLASPKTEIAFEKEEIF